MSSYTEKTYIIFLDLPSRLQLSLDFLRSELSKSNLVYPAHITIKQDEDYRVNIKQFIKIVTGIILKYNAFQIKIDKPASKKSDLGWNVYLPVRSPELRSLTLELCEILKPLIDTNSPRALLSTNWEQSEEHFSHISIKGTSDEDKHRELISKINNYEFNISFPYKCVCSTVTIAVWHNNAWQVMKKLRLKNAE